LQTILAKFIGIPSIGSLIIAYLTCVNSFESDYNPCGNIFNNYIIWTKYLL